MNISINAIHFRASSRLISVVKQRVASLKKYNSHMDSVKIFLRLENNHLKKNKLSEIHVHLPGKNLIVRKRSETFEKSTSLAKSVLIKILAKSKQKVKSLKKD
jgi:putative sigma-54 modulation protein